MNRLYLLILAFLLPAAISTAQQRVKLTSPDGKIVFEVSAGSEYPVYSVSYGKTPLVKEARLGFEFDSGEFGRDVRFGKSTVRSGHETYDLVVGKTSHVDEPFREITIPMIENNAPHRRIDLVVKAFDNGVGFRYVFPEQEGWESYTMFDEKTTFDLAGDPEVLTMFLDSYTTSHEGFYTDLKYSDIPAGKLMEMPTLFRYPGGIYMAVTEAAILDYAGMYLMREDGLLKGKLSPWPGQEKIKVVSDLPHRTPWRVFSISDRIGGLIESNILTNLADPCKIEDISWIRPGKTTFTWWNGNVVPDTTFSPGNNFETNQYYIDFAARNGLEYHSIYGYAETPWYVDDGFDFSKAGPTTDLTRSIAPLDMRHIADYANSNNVGIHVWVNWEALYRQIDEAYAQFEKWGVNGMMIDFMDRDDQQMIRAQEEFLAKGAEHKLFVQFHGSSKPSGLHRTYPNEFTREGTRNYECYKWSVDMGADLDIAIPFTRLLAGPADYHLGGFRAVPREEFRIQYTNPLVMNTRCHMLGMYVVMESYLGMVCDTPWSYEGQPGFEFIRQMPTTWDQTLVPLAEVMQYVTIARRKGVDWYVGTINNSTARELRLPLDFLGEGEYTAEIYTDAPDVASNPNHLVKEVRKVDRTTVIELPLAPEGGSVIRITK